MAGFLSCQQIVKKFCKSYSAGRLIATRRYLSADAHQVDLKKAEAAAAAQGDTLRLLALMASVPVALVIFWKNLEFAEKEPDPMAESDPSKDHFITKFMRKHKIYDEDADRRLRDDNLRRNHTKMLAHIEKKKRPEYPQLPTYARLFGMPRLSLAKPKLPNTMDD